MRTCCIVIWLLLTAVTAFGQTRSEIDRYKHALAVAPVDSARLSALYDLSIAYLDLLPDSALIYAREGYELSNRSGDRDYQRTFLEISGDIYESFANFPLALEQFLAAMKIAEKADDQRMVGNLYSDIGRLSAGQDDYVDALRHALKAKQILKEGNYKEELAGVLLNLGYYYFQVDSLADASQFETILCYQSCNFNFLQAALDCETEGYGLVRALNLREHLSEAYQNLGMIEERLGDEGVALSYYRASLTAPNSYKTANDAYLLIADYFLRKHHEDSAIYYGKKALVAADSGKVIMGMIKACTMLFRLYDKKDPSAAFAYLKAAFNAREKLFSSERQRHIRNLKENEQQRQRERLLEREKEESYLTTMTIAVTLVALAIVVFFLIRANRIGRRWKSFLGVSLLLLVFEFVNLQLHLKFQAIFHHNILYEFGMIVLASVILSRLHHHSSEILENYISLKERYRQSALRVREKLKINQPPKIKS